jgi:hypothetical protein
MSGSVGSAWLSPNELMTARYGNQIAGDAHQNALIHQQLGAASLQKSQQDLSLTDMQVTAQSALALASMDESHAAAAYPTMVQNLQSQGFGKSLPAAYPGHDVAMSFVSRAVPILDQYKMGLYIPPGLADMLKHPYDPSASAAPSGGGASEPLSSDKATALKQIAQRESGGDPTILNSVAREDPTAYARGATASGKYQIVNSTWREGASLAGVDASKYATASAAPEAVQDHVASALWDKYGNKPWQKGAQDWVKGADGRYSLAAVPQAPAGGAATPAPYQVAGPAMPPPGASGADLMGPRQLPPTGP